MDTPVDACGPIEDVTYPQTRVPHGGISEPHGIPAECSSVTSVVGTERGNVREGLRERVCGGNESKGC